MNNEFQSHQGKQQFKIQSFLKGRVIPAKKLNDSFLFHNQRMIALLKNGMLVYYSKCFQSKQQNTHLIQSKPKCGVYFNHVLYSCVKISEKEVELIIKFKKSQLYNFDDNQFSFVRDPKSQDIVLWIFVIQIDEQLQNQNLDIYKGPDSLNSLYNFQQPCIDVNLQKSNYQQVKTEKTSIEQRMYTIDAKNKKKKVQWFDDFTQNQQKNSNTLQNLSEQTTQIGKSIQQDEWEVNEEKTDITIKNIQIRRLSFRLNEPKQSTKIE